ncbi:MAG: hypothetical protein VKM92_03900 [Cyanobacteriota bacterium]|nr:hypothetical protein [Cyanobacteriota bacterium]
MVFCFSTLAPARANWQRQTIQQLQQTTLNATRQAEFQRSGLQAVAASGIRATAPLIEQGQWNPAVGYLPALPGGVFSLQLSSQAADPEAPVSFDAPSATAGRRSTSVAPNLLEASIQPDGSLRAGPGSAASEVRLTVTQTYSVF